LSSRSVFHFAKCFVPCHYSRFPLFFNTKQVALLRVLFSFLKKITIHWDISKKSSESVNCPHSWVVDNWQIPAFTQCTAVHVAVSCRGWNRITGTCNSTSLHPAKCVKWMSIVRASKLPGGELSPQSSSVQWRSTHAHLSSPIVTQILSSCLLASVRFFVPATPIRQASPIIQPERILLNSSRNHKQYNSTHAQQFKSTSIYFLRSKINAILG
jgi:hypothetical protein